MSSVLWALPLFATTTWAYVYPLSLDHQLCPPSLLANLHGEYEDHAYTNRGMEQMQTVMPPFLQLEKILLQLAARPGTRVLEHGCGLGRNLLEMQSTAPAVQFFGTNYWGYPYHQASENVTDLLLTAKHFDIPLVCQPNGQPILPKVQLLDSIAAQWFQYPYPDASVDLIVSRDALHRGKLAPNQMHLFMPRMLRVLKPGGLAVLHIGYGIFHAYPTLANRTWAGEGNFTILGVVDTTETIHNGRVSFLLYTAGKWGTWGVVMRRCPELFHRSPLKDCILPPGFVPPYEEDLSLWQSNVDIVPSPDLSAEMKEYAVGELVFIKAIVDVLQRYNKTGVFTE